MSIEKLIELMDEYSDLWSKLNKQEQDADTKRWRMAYSLEERESFRQRREAVEHEVASVGLSIGKDEDDVTCLWKYTMP